MGKDELPSELIDLAQSLMAEITARLENLAEVAAGHQLKMIASHELIRGIQSVLLLAEAHRELLNAPAPNPLETIPTASPP